MSIKVLEGRVLDLLGPIAKGRCFTSLTLNLRTGGRPRVDAVEIVINGHGHEIQRDVRFEFTGEDWLAVGGAVWT
jgi:hypothetical protein